MSAIVKPIIEVNSVSRIFKSTKKGEGLKEAFKLLWNPQYQEHRALNEVSFKIEKGSFTGLIGSNGAGKTTLLKILSGLIAPTSGIARVMGIDPFTRPIEFRRKIALVMGQKAQLWWDLPAVDAFELLKAIYEIPNKVYRERLSLLTDLLKVKEHLNTQIRRLSLGERMKMELIGALIHWPDIVYLDEPTIGLDVVAAQNLREFLRKFNQSEGATIILTSHNMDDIEMLCSRILILKTGSLIYDGAPQGLIDHHQKQFKLKLSGNPTTAELSQLTMIASDHIMIQNDASNSETQSSPDYVFSIHETQVLPTLQKLILKYQITGMAIEGESLESVIHKIYSEERVL